MIRAALLSPRFLPCTMMVLQAGAALRYGLARQMGPTVYWISAVGITYAVTFLLGSK